MNLPMIGFLVLVLMIALLAFLSRGKGGRSLAGESVQEQSAEVITDTETLLEQLRTGKPEQKVQAISQLKGAAPDGLTEILVQAMGDKNEQVKLTAAGALIELKDPEAIPLLIEALKDPAKWLPARVAEVLVNLGAAVVPYLKTAISEGDESLRAYAIQILGMLDVPEAGSLLLESLRDSSVEVRRAASTAIAENTPQEALESLLASVQDSDGRVRVQVINALGNLRSEEAVEVLAMASRDSDWAVAASAVKALIKIGGKAEPVLKKIATDPENPGHKQAQAYLKNMVKVPGIKVNITFGSTEKEL